MIFRSKKGRNLQEEARGALQNRSEFSIENGNKNDSTVWYHICSGHHDNKAKKLTLLFYCLVLYFQSCTSVLQRYCLIKKKKLSEEEKNN